MKLGWETDLSFPPRSSPSTSILYPLFFLLCTFAPLHLCVFFFSRFFFLRFFFSRFFFSRFFFFAAASGATTGAWNFWCIIGSLRCPY